MPRQQQLVYLLIVLFFNIISTNSDGDKSTSNSTVYQNPRLPPENDSPDRHNDDISRYDNIYRPSLAPTLSGDGYIQGNPTCLPTSKSSYTAGSPTQVPTLSTSYIAGSPTQVPTLSTSYIAGSPTLVPTYVNGSPTPRPSLSPSSSSLQPTLSPSTSPSPYQTRSPSQVPSHSPTPKNNPILLVSEDNFEFFIYNSTVNSQSPSIISSAASKYILSSNETKVLVAISNNKNANSKSRYLQSDDMTAVFLGYTAPYTNKAGATIDSTAAASLLRASIFNGALQLAIRNESKYFNGTLQWVVVCLDESCTNLSQDLQTLSSEACDNNGPTLYDQFYGWDQQMHGYIVWLIVLILSWFSMTVITATALFSRYYYDINRLRDIKCFICYRSTTMTLTSVLETSKFIVGCFVFNLCILRTFALLLIIVLTIGNQFVGNFACVEFSIILNNNEAYSKLYILIYALFYPLLLATVIGRQTWHDAELRNIGFVHLLADSRFHLKIAMILRKIAAGIAALCLSLLMTLLIVNFAITSSAIIKIVQSVQLICAITVIILQSYRTYGTRNIRLELRSPFDSTFSTLQKPTISNTRAINNSSNRNNSSSLDDCKDDDELDRLERLDDSSDTEDEPFQPQVSDNVTIILTLFTSALSIVTGVPYLFKKALLSLIVFSVITRISEILTVLSLVSTFKVQNVSLQLLISRELRERVNRVVKSSISSSVRKVYRSTISTDIRKDYVYHEGNDSELNGEDNQSLISDLTTTTKHPIYAKLSPIEENPLASFHTGEKNDKVPHWIKKWETTSGAENLKNIKDQNNEKVSDSTASSFGTHWNDIANKGNGMSDNQINRDIIRTSKLEM